MKTTNEIRNAAAQRYAAAQRRFLAAKKDYEAASARYAAAQRVARIEGTDEALEALARIEAEFVVVCAAFDAAIEAKKLA